jgi:hypothetical protein
MSDGKRIDPFLERELDALLTENQELHVERRRLGELRFLLRSVAKLPHRSIRRRLSRTLRDNEEVLAPPGDVHALAEKVVELLEDPERADYRALHDEVARQT